MPRKINPTSWIIVIFLMTGWIGIWLGYYFFTHGHNYNHSHNIIKALINWDAGWYMDIVQHGYSYNGNPNLQQNIAFFPLYPIIMKLFSLLFGLRNGISTIIPSLAIGIISIYTFHILAAIKLTKKGALFATAAYALYPGATFFFSAYPTSIMNLLVIVTFLAFNNKKYFTAAIATGISTASGALLVFLSATISLSYAKTILSKRNESINSKIFKIILFGLLSISGIIGFMFFQKISFGTPFAFVDVQKAWGSDSIPQRLFHIISFYPIFGGGYGGFFRSIFFIEPTNQTPQGSVEFITNTFVILMAIYSTWILYKFKEYLFTLYSFMVVSAYIWFIGSVQGPSSSFRLLYIDVPMFIAAGIYYQNSNKTFLSYTFLACSVLSLILQLAFFVSGYWVI
ncbi:MAG: hypothetical protein AB7C98_05840 [Acidithiobacillus sp.]